MSLEVKKVSAIGTGTQVKALESERKDSKVVALANGKLPQNTVPAKTPSFISRHATALTFGAGALAVGAAVGGLVAKFGAEAVAAKTALVYLSAVHPILYTLVTVLSKTSLFALQHVVIPAVLPILTHAAIVALIVYITYKAVLMVKDSVISAIKDFPGGSYVLDLLNAIFGAVKASFDDESETKFDDKQAVSQANQKSLVEKLFDEFDTLLQDDLLAELEKSPEQTTAVVTDQPSSSAMAAIKQFIIPPAPQTVSLLTGETLSSRVTKEEEPQGWFNFFFGNIDEGSDEETDDIEMTSVRSSGLFSIGEDD